MRITNTSEGPRGVVVDGSPVMLAPGESRDDLTVKDGDLEAAKRSGWFAFDAAEKKEGAATKSTASLKAVHKGGGAYVIVDGDKEVKAGLNKSDADAFNAMSDEDKAAYVKP